MSPNHAFMGSPFGTPFQPRLGTFASVPLQGRPTGVIGVPYPTMLWNWYNRYLPPYWPPYIPFEGPVGQAVAMRPG